MAESGLHLFGGSTSQSDSIAGRGVSSDERGGVEQL